MRNSSALVQLALDNLKCTQTALAKSMGVSSAQISKWKSGEGMSNEQEKKLRGFAGIGEHDPAIVLNVGSTDDADKWHRLFTFIANNMLGDFDCLEVGERITDVCPLYDACGGLDWHTFSVLEEMGVALPKPFPQEIDFDYEVALARNDVRLSQFGVLNQHKLTLLIRDIYKATVVVSIFYTDYVQDLVLDNDNYPDLWDAGEEIDAHLMELAAAKLDKVDLEFAPNFPKFQRDTKAMITGWLFDVKEEAIRAGLPLKAELLDMVYKPLKRMAREEDCVETFDANSERVHPDIYMNELLAGMREMRERLASIEAKLGINTQTPV
ncbi:MAG: hypothetical protein WCG50_04110 [Rhodoferax sp.]|uniref:hypothetical protein n=1 Tax=Rhodoferax sp. TaxID=50421 RepID=UPI00301A5388